MKIQGQIDLPGDKSISHRALMNKLAANGAWNKGLEQ